jgi:hypothetical protein
MVEQREHALSTLRTAEIGLANAPHDSMFDDRLSPVMAPLARDHATRSVGVARAESVAKVIPRSRCMNCSSCRRRVRGQRLPPGWKVSGDAVLCRQCLRQRYRFRSITMAVMEPIGAAWRDLRAVLEESCVHATPHGEVWQARIAEGQPVVRVLIRDRWWELRLKSAGWTGGKKAAYERVAFGAAAGELFIHRAPIEDTQLGNRSDRNPDTHSRIICKIVAWLPRKKVEDSKEPQSAPPGLAHRLDPSAHLKETNIADLREAIRANWVSFPSQVPTFPKHDRPDLQRQLAQLYFVLGWNCNDIGARYGLVPARVRQILNMWKHRAVKTGYIQ